MRKCFAISILQLLRQSNVVSSFPMFLHAAENLDDVWVRDFNTINSTTKSNIANLADGIALGVEAVSLPVASGLAPVVPLNGTRTNTTRTNTNTAIYPTLLSNTTATDTTPTTTPGPSTNLTNPTSLIPTTSTVTASPIAGGSGVLAIDLVNKLPSENVMAYISGLDPNGKLVMLGRDGTWINPTAYSGVPRAITEPVAIPLGKPNTTLPITLPGYLESARVWIVDGTLQFYVVATPNGAGLVEPAAVNPNDPNSMRNYGFAELSWAGEYGIYADITAVDFVGLPLGIQLQNTDNSVQTILGTPTNAAVTLCAKLQAQAKRDGRPWDQLCAYDPNNKLIRVLAPSNLISQNASAFGSYFSQYVNRVWAQYSRQDLIINTQTSAGNITCRVQGTMLQCAGDNRGYAKPSSADIFGCNSGPFAIQQGDNSIHYAVVPRLCAAFNRSTLLLKGGNVQPGLPPSKYYSNPSSGPKNWYSKFVHEIEVGGKGYAFPYDDVTPDFGGDQSGLVSSTNPRKFTIIIGGT